MNSNAIKFKNCVTALIVFMMLFTLISPLNVYAEPDDGSDTEGGSEVEVVYNEGFSDDVERTIMAGTTEIESGIDIEYNNRSNYYDFSSLEVSSSNTDVLEVEISDYYNSSKDYLVMKGISPGTAILTVRVPRKNIEVNLEITVLPRTDAVFDKFPGNKTLKKGESFKLESIYFINCGAYSDSVWLDDCKVTTSNTKAVKVTKNGDYCTIKAVGPGKATITLTVNKDNESKGLKKSFVITVKQGAKATAPVLFKQTNFNSHLIYNRMDVGFKVKNHEAVYQLWRSKNPNKGFVCVKTIKVTDEGALGYFIPYMGICMDAGEIARFDDFSKKYPLKANTKYYYKVRCRYYDSYHSNAWSNFSPVRAYWTPPKPVSDSKVKFNKSTRKVTMPKVKGAVAYKYTASNVTKLGYNIFGQPVYYKVTATRANKGRIFKVANLRDGKRPEEVYDVVPIAKHGNYYYTHGHRAVKKLSVFSDWDAYSFVN